MWAAGRTLRGFSTTAGLSLAALLALALLGQPSLAQAQSLPQEPRDAGSTRAASPANGDGWSRRLARSHFERGLKLEQRDDIAGALREYTQSIAIESTLGEAYLRLGGLRARMGDSREAELVYSEAARLSDQRAQALFRRSRLRRAAGRSGQALSDLEASVALEANRDALRELAQQYVEAHAWSAALATVRRLAASALASGDAPEFEAARLEASALCVLAAETDPSNASVSKHDWVGRALAHIARR